MTNLFGQVAEARSLDTKRRGTAALSACTASSATAVASSCTTLLSNAVVIPSKKNIAKQVKSEFDGNCAPSHGFLEEDEGEEREAALSSPIKAGERLSSAVSHTAMANEIIQLIS